MTNKIHRASTTWGGRPAIAVHRGESRGEEHGKEKRQRLPLRYTHENHNTTAPEVWGFHTSRSSAPPAGWPTVASVLTLSPWRWHQTPQVTGRSRGNDPTSDANCKSRLSLCFRPTSSRSEVPTNPLGFDQFAGGHSMSQAWQLGRARHTGSF